MRPPFWMTEKSFFFTPPTNVFQSSPKLAEIIFTPSLRKAIICFWDFQNRLPGTANQNMPLSQQTGVEWIVSHRIFDGFTPNLLRELVTLFWGRLTCFLSHMTAWPPDCCLQQYLHIFSHWSLWQPLEPYGKKFWNLAPSLSLVLSLYLPSFLSLIGALYLHQLVKIGTVGFPGSRLV